LDFEFSADQELLRESVRRFLGDRAPISPYVRAMLDDPRGTSPEVWSGLAELGVTGLLVPEAFGGAGMGMVDIAVVAEEMGRALAPSPLAATWAAKLLHPGLEGRGAVAQWDADGSADPERPTLRAQDGRLTGTKIAVPNADVADTIVVTAAGGRHFAVPAGDAAIEPARALDPTRPLFTVRLDGAPGEELSGDFSRAWHAIAVMAAAESVGVAARVTGMAVDYAKERKQFGRAIGSYQAVSHACAQMFLATEGARAVTYWAAWALDHDPEAARQAAYCAKAYASDAAVNAARSALQVHGGIGFTWEHDLHLYLKRAEANAHAYGDAVWHREQLAELLL